MHVQKRPDSSIRRQHQSSRQKRLPSRLLGTPTNWELLPRATGALTANQPVCSTAGSSHTRTGGTGLSTGAPGERRSLPATLRTSPSPLTTPQKTPATATRALTATGDAATGLSARAPVQLALASWTRLAPGAATSPGVDAAATAARVMQQQQALGVQRAVLLLVLRQPPVTQL
jgi:hypothetical protein